MTMTKPMTEDEAAELLGCQRREIESVLFAPAGPVIRTTDGNAYVNATEPDYEGKTGLMLLAPPSEGPVTTVDGVTRWNSMRLWVEHPPPEDEETEDEPEASPSTEAPADDVTPVAPAPPPPSREELEGTDMVELRELCDTLGLDDVPRNARAPMVDAVLAYYAQDEE